MKCPDCGSTNTQRTGYRYDYDCRECIAKRAELVKQESLERKRRFEEPPDYLNWSHSSDENYGLPVRVAIHGGRYKTDCGD